MNISIFGLGYVGTVSCACLAKLGHNIIGVDIKQKKVDAINAGISPVTEPNLTDLLREAIANKKLFATTDHQLAIQKSELAIICVGTPPNEIGDIDTSAIENLCSLIAQSIKNHPANLFIVINRSTCTPEVHHKLMNILSAKSGRAFGKNISYVVHPEFLREGTGIEDFRHPTRIIFGCSDSTCKEKLNQLYPTIDAPIFFISPESAAMVKYADNCFHALKVTFANEIGLLCKKLNIDAREVMSLLCKDTKLNISPKYLKPGPPFGGSCLPKDLRAILNAARKYAIPLPMLSATIESNRIQTETIVNAISSNARQPIGIIGLTFKENTDDVRESPMVRIVEQLIGKGHKVLIYDSTLAPQNLIGSNREFAFAAIPHLTDLLRNDLQSVIDSAETIVISHRLNPKIWSTVSFRNDQKIFDLADIDSLKSHPNYIGLYW